ncbi:MAG: citryl-CoA lyase [Methanobacterium sp.]|nr:citryl-CoA lyase [Methanobacterium sp.]
MAINIENMDEFLKFRNPKWKTSITKVEPNRIITRGYSQEELIGHLSFPDMVYLLINGNKPSKNESNMLEAVLVSFCDHGTTPPSTQIARLMASAGSPLNTCVSGGIMAFGKHHAGALELCMKILQEKLQNGVIDETAEQTLDLSLSNIVSTKDINLLAYNIVEEYLQKNQKIPGYGHRYHKEDPRAPKLIETAQKYGFYGNHTQLAMAIGKILFERKNIHINVDGANAGILSDMGFTWKLGTGIFMIGRIPALISHVHEEKTQETPFKKLIETDEIYYDGVDERNPNEDIKMV